MNQLFIPILLGDNITENITEEVNKNIDVGVMQKFMEDLPEKALHMGVRILFAVLFFLIGMQVIKILRNILKRSLRHANADKGVTQFLDSFIRASLYIILVFIIANSFGLDAASAAAVLGSAGVAIGLAIQGSLSNLAGGVIILLVKPFRVGDYIIEDNYKNEGTVSEIQIFYTKLTTSDEKIIVIPNGTLANTSITNVTETYKRRLDIKIGISYKADLQLAKEILYKLIMQDKATLKDHDIIVAVDELAMNAVILCARFYVRNEEYMNAKWRLTEQIKLKFDDNQIGIPYQQIDIHIEK